MEIHIEFKPELQKQTTLVINNVNKVAALHRVWSNSICDIAIFELRNSKHLSNVDPQKNRFQTTNMQKKPHTKHASKIKNWLRSDVQKDLHSRSSQCKRTTRLTTSVLGSNEKKSRIQNSPKRLAEVHTRDEHIHSIICGIFPWETSRITSRKSRNTIPKSRKSYDMQRSRLTVRNVGASFRQENNEYAIVSWMCYVSMGKIWMLSVCRLNCYRIVLLLCVFMGMSVVGSTRWNVDGTCLICGSFCVFFKNVCTFSCTVIR